MDFGVTTCGHYYSILMKLLGLSDILLQYRRTSRSLLPALAKGLQSLSFNSCISKSWSMSLAPAICLEVGLNLVQLLTSDLLSTLLSTPSLAFAVDCDVV